MTRLPATIALVRAVLAALRQRLLYLGLIATTAGIASLVVRDQFGMWAWLLTVLCLCAVAVDWGRSHPDPEAALAVGWIVHRDDGECYVSDRLRVLADMEPLEDAA